MSILNKLVKTQQEYAHLIKQHFFQVEIFSYQWWILVTTMIVLWVLWLILLDRKHFRNILMIGLFSSVFAIVLDDIGLSRALWAYPYKVIFVTTRLSPVDLCIIPVAFMLIYQYARKWTWYMIFSILFALFASFVAEPLFVKMNMYHMEHWHFYYSAPIYV